MLEKENQRGIERDQNTFMILFSPKIEIGNLWPIQVSDTIISEITYSTYR